MRSVRVNGGMGVFDDKLGGLRGKMGFGEMDGREARR
jgi:hypothetical protein